LKKIKRLRRMWGKDEEFYLIWSEKGVETMGVEVKGRCGYGSFREKARVREGVC